MKFKKIFLLLIIFICSFSVIGCVNNDNNNNNNQNNNNNNNNNQNKDITIKISTDLNNYYVDDSIIIDIDCSEKSLYSDINLIVENSIEFEQINNVIIPLEDGKINLYAKYNNVISNTIELSIEKSIYNTDPYQNINYSIFYDKYEEAINVKDVEYRTKHGLMSGNLILPNQEPEIGFQPRENDKFIRNTSVYFSSEKNIYYIVDGYGEIVDMVIKNGGYIGLDEVASYLLAFGDIPANYTENKSGNPMYSPWGAYLRLNNTQFSGNTTKYPYEPVLPNISGCGGDLSYYEIDFGTTGTDCDPRYHAEIYNDGYDITRGAARLVYTRYDKNGDNIIDVNEKYVFYTYNHYNDFQEYLNYQGGWGEMFGNITGGGTLSSKKDYNPTPYVEVIRKTFTSLSEYTYKARIIVCDLDLLNKNEIINF